MGMANHTIGVIDEGSYLLVVFVSLIWRGLAYVGMAST